MSLFTWSAAAFACVDEPTSTIFAYDANIDGPTWLKQLPRRILAIAGGGTMLATLDDAGTVGFWSGRDGSAMGHAAVPGAHLLTLAWGNGCAIAAPDRIDFLDARGQRTLPIRGATALRFSRDDAKLAIGFPDGLVSFVDVASGASLGQAQVASKGTPVVSLVERAVNAEWLVAAGDSLHAIERIGAPDTRRVTGMGGTTLKEIAANERGTLIAMQANDDLAVVIAWPSRDTAGNLRYMDRKVTGVAVGSRALWVGLDKGDGNKLDLATGDLYRTDPHPGRVRNRWLVSTGHHPEVARPAL